MAKIKCRYGTHVVDSKGVKTILKPGEHSYPKLDVTDPLVQQQLKVYRDDAQTVEFNFSLECDLTEEERAAKAKKLAARKAKADVRGSDKTPAKPGRKRVANPGDGGVSDKKPD